MIARRVAAELGHKTFRIFHNNLALRNKSWALGSGQSDAVCIRVDSSGCFAMSWVWGLRAAPDITNGDIHEAEKNFYKDNYKATGLKETHHYSSSLRYSCNWHIRLGGPKRRFLSPYKLGMHR